MIISLGHMIYVFVVVVVVVPYSSILSHQELLFLPFEFNYSLCDLMTMIQHKILDVPCYTQLPLYRSECSSERCSFPVFL